MFSDDYFKNLVADSIEIFDAGTSASLGLKIGATTIFSRHIAAIVSFKHKPFVLVVTFNHDNYHKVYGGIPSLVERIDDPEDSIKDIYIADDTLWLELGNQTICVAEGVMQDQVKVGMGFYQPALDNTKLEIYRTVAMTAHLNGNLFLPTTQTENIAMWESADLKNEWRRGCYERFIRSFTRFTKEYYLKLKEVREARIANASEMWKLPYLENGVPVWDFLLND